MHFGEHLTIDGYGGSFELLNSRDFVMDTLFRIVKEMNMKMLADPQVFFAEGNNLKDPGGWSGFVIIQESHVSIHTFPYRGFVSTDIYTCKNNLDKRLFTSLVKEAFKLKDVEANFILRGTKYPDNNIY